jgi:hypothetical protein
MSTQAMSWAFEQQELSTGAKFLLVAIADVADGHGVAWCGRVLLAERCCCTPKTVSENMAKLEDAGLIVRRERRRLNGSRTSDWIVLAPNALDRGLMRDAPADEFPATICELARGSGNKNTPGQVTKTGSPDPSEEPLEESFPDGKPKNPVAEVFEYWRGRMSPRARLTGDKRAKIKARLAEGYTVDQLKAAVDGCARSAFHMGRQPGQPQKHNSVDLIFRNGSNVERFEAMASMPQSEAERVAAKFAHLDA